MSVTVPNGCSVHHPIVIDIEQLTDEMIDWYVTVGGEASSAIEWTARGQEISVRYVQYKQGKRSYCHRNGTKQVRLHFREEDAAVATLFLLKFDQYVIKHNINMEFYS